MEKCKQINKKKDQLMRVYHSKHFELAKKDVLQYIKALLRLLKPDKITGYLRFGMEDPAVTGEILGVMSFALPLYQSYLRIYPDFTEQCLEAELIGKGKIILFSIAKIGIQVFFNKNLIKVKNKVQTIMEA